jgi:hypothetical protein
MLSYCIKSPPQIPLQLLTKNHPQPWTVLSQSDFSQDNPVARHVAIEDKLQSHVDSEAADIDDRAVVVLFGVMIFPVVSITSAPVQTTA